MAPNALTSSSGPSSGVPSRTPSAARPAGARRRSARLAPLGLLGLLLALSLPARPAHADWLTWTLTASAGFGYEVHPKHHEQATNVMATGGLGFLGDCLRLELGALAAYGALWAHGPRHAQFELRPMVRIKPPLIPLYARAVFAGLFPFVDRANVAYGGALGVNVPIGRLGIMAEVGTLPRRVDHVTHWILEARAGLSVRL